MSALFNARLLSFRNQLASFDAIPQLALLGLASGLITGLVILLFRAATEIPLKLALPNGSAEGFESLPVNARFILPVMGGIILGLILYLFRVENRKVGVAHVMERLSYHQGYISFKSGVLQFLCGVFTISSGQSCGREGPAVHLGATSSSLLGQWLQLPNNSIRTLVGCGTAAAISASFNTPIAGVIFAMEVVMLEYTLNGFTPVIIAAVAAALVTQTVYGNEPAFQVPSYDMQSFWELPFIVMMAVMVGLMASGFIRLMTLTQQKIRVALEWRLVGAGLLTGMVGLVVPDIMGIGYDTVQVAIQGDFPVMLMLTICLTKLVVTSITIGMGMPSGIIGPSLFIGATLGGAMGVIAQIAFPEHASAVGFYAILGMGAMMGALLQAPLAAITAVVELTRSPDIILPTMLIIVCASNFTAHFFRQRSVFVTQLENQGLDYKEEPLTVALRRVAVGALMDRSFTRSRQRISYVEAADMLKQKPNWILIDGEHGPKALLPAAELAKYLEQRDPTDEPHTEKDIDLIEIPAQRKDLAPLNIQATLEEALRELQRKRVSALYIERTSAPMIKPISGIVTREAIENYYQIKG
ncbi:MAG: chloride channel protein [Hahellaceae bacterium]|nr:chloride channel protein [Hahellaceae bacterium]